MAAAQGRAAPARAQPREAARRAASLAAHAAENGAPASGLSCPLSPRKERLRERRKGGKGCLGRQGEGRQEVIGGSSMFRASGHTGKANHRCSAECTRGRETVKSVERGEREC
eukprot:4664423-Pleurochrysis_carterae.AAC.2